ncbi:hypothetical protein DPMN_044844 [Dreissena polymorpha]|uniref:Uncharacterized protein n=1 Tax=Dreissena polymorpha TaxID=45954 RepID=A0A9D4D5C7_DREPO|nr:hypothetical protein DPMN_044844 [Dreissena polymorpha]
MYCTLGVYVRLQIHLAGGALIFQVGISAFLYGRGECGGVGVKPVVVFGLPRSKDINVNCVSDVIPSIFGCAIRRFQLEHLRKGLVQLGNLVGGSGLVHINMRFSLRPRAVNLLRLKPHFPAIPRVIVVAVSNVKGASKENAFQCRSPGNDQVELVPVLDRWCLQVSFCCGLIRKKLMVMLRSWYEHSSRSHCPFFSYQRRFLQHKICGPRPLKSPIYTRCSYYGIPWKASLASCTTCHLNSWWR